MDKLKLPIIKGKTGPKKLTMDEYLEFVLMNIVHVRNKMSDKKRQDQPVMPKDRFKI